MENNQKENNKLVIEHHVYIHKNEADSQKASKDWKFWIGTLVKLAIPFATAFAAWYFRNV